MTGLKGQCVCGAVRFSVTKAPIITHACHCSWCQKEASGGFAANTLVETSAIEVDQGEVVETVLPSASGKGQIVCRCGDCGVTLWSHFAGSGRGIAFVRLGVMAPGHGISPDVQIFVASKAPWVVLPAGVPTYDAFYNPPEVWGKEGLARVIAAQSETQDA